MTTPSAMQPTSSASSADKFDPINFGSGSILWDLIDAWSRATPGDSSECRANAVESHVKYLISKYVDLASQTIVPQVVQAPIPDILFDGYAVYKELTKAEESRTSYVSVSNVLDAVVRLMRKSVAAPIVATVPSEPVAWSATVTLNGNVVNSILSREPIPKQQIDDAQSVGYVYTVTPLYAAPSTAEQASDVRNAAIEQCASVCRDYAESMRGNGLAVSADVCCERILNFKESS